MKKVYYVTGSRSDFGLMKSTLQCLQDSKKINLSLIVTGMHLIDFHDSLKEIKNSEFKISAEIDILVKEPDGKIDISASVGKGITEFSRFFSKNKPDFLLIEGDRFEIFAAAIAAAFKDIPIIHMSGGDVSKSIDDSIRHSLTKLSHIHLPGTKKSAERIVRMGEEKWRVEMVGTPINFVSRDKKEIETELGIDLSKDTIILLFHPISTELQSISTNLTELLSAVKESGMQIVAIFPNGEPGCDIICDAYKKLAKSTPLHLYSSLPSDVFTGLMKHATLMVGNSSAGIVEAPFFGLPAVNVGSRQNGRERASNVIDCSYSRLQIAKAIAKARSTQFRKKIKQGINPYACKKGVEKNVVEVIENMDIDKEKLLFKKSFSEE